MKFGYLHHLTPCFLEIHLRQLSRHHIRRTILTLENHIIIACTATGLLLCLCPRPPRLYTLHHHLELLLPMSLPLLETEVVYPICEQTPSHQQSHHTRLPHVLQIKSHIYHEPSLDMRRVTKRAKCPLSEHVILFARLHYRRCLNEHHTSPDHHLNHRRCLKDVHLHQGSPYERTTSNCQMHLRA